MTEVESPHDYTPKVAIDNSYDYYHERVHDVILNFYDVSNGFTKVYSPFYLNREVDAFWHFSISVFGLECWYSHIGMYIERQKTLDFILGPPKRTRYLGHTYLYPLVFHEFLSHIAENYTKQLYSLLNNNSAHFCDDISRFLIGHGISENLLTHHSELINSTLSPLLTPWINKFERNLSKYYQNNEPKNIETESILNLSDNELSFDFHLLSIIGKHRNAFKSIDNKHTQFINMIQRSFSKLQDDFTRNRSLGENVSYLSPSEPKFYIYILDKLVLWFSFHSNESFVSPVFNVTRSRANSDSLLSKNDIIICHCKYNSVRDQWPDRFSFEASFSPNNLSKYTITTDGLLFFDNILFSNIQFNNTITFASLALLRLFVNYSCVFRFFTTPKGIVFVQRLCIKFLSYPFHTHKANMTMCLCILMNLLSHTNDYNIDIIFSDSVIFEKLIGSIRVSDKIARLTSAGILVNIALALNRQVKNERPTSQSLHIRCITALVQALSVENDDSCAIRFFIALSILIFKRSQLLRVLLVLNFKDRILKKYEPILFDTNGSMSNQTSDLCNYVKDFKILIDIIDTHSMNNRKSFSQKTKTNQLSDDIISTAIRQFYKNSPSFIHK